MENETNIQPEEIQQKFIDGINVSVLNELTDEQIRHFLDILREV